MVLGAKQSLTLDVRRTIPSCMSKLSRTKGAAWEREVAKLFNEAMPGADAKRGLSQARNGAEVADVDIPWFWVEAKHRRAVTAQGALRQALEASKGSGKVPVAVLKLHRQEPFVALYLPDFLALVNKLWTTGPGGVGRGPQDRLFGRIDGNQERNEENRGAEKGAKGSSE